MSGKNYKQEGNVLTQAPKLQAEAARADTFMPVKANIPNKSRTLQIVDALQKDLPSAGGDLGAVFTRMRGEAFIKGKNDAAWGLVPSSDASQSEKNGVTYANARTLSLQKSREQKMYASTSGSLTDEEYNKQIALNGSALLSQVGEDPVAISVAATTWGDQAATFADARYTAVQKQDQVNKYNSLVASFAELAARGGDPGDLGANVDSLLEEAQHNGTTTVMMKKALIDAATTAASQEGNGALLQSTKDKGYFEGSGALQAAQSNLLANTRREEIDAIAKAESDNITRAEVDSTVTESDFYNSMKSVVYRDGTSAVSTPEKMRSLWAEVERSRNNNYKAKLMANSLEYSDLMGRREADQSLTRVAMYNPTKKEVAQTLINYKDSLSVKYRKDMAMLGDGVDPETLNAKVLRTAEFRARYIKGVTDNGLVDENLKKQISSLLYSDPSNNAEGLNSATATTLAYMSDMDDAGGLGLREHTTPKSLALYQMYRRNIDGGGMNEQQAYSVALSAVNAPKLTVDDKTSRRMNRDAKSDVRDILDDGTWWGLAGTRTQDFYVNRMSSEVVEYAMQLASFTRDPEGSVKEAARSIAGNHTRLPDGSIIDQPAKWLANATGINSGEVLKELVNFKDAIADIDNQEGFKYLILNGGSEEAESWIPVVSAKGKTIQWVNEKNMPMTRPILLSVVGGWGVKEILAAEENEGNLIKAARTKMAEEAKKSASGMYAARSQEILSATKTQRGT